MLIDLKQQLNPGDTFDLTLRFEHPGEQVMHVEVKSMEAWKMGCPRCLAVIFDTQKDLGL